MKKFFVEGIEVHCGGREPLNSRILVFISDKNVYAIKAQKDSKHWLVNNTIGWHSSYALGVEPKEAGVQDIFKSRFMKLKFLLKRVVKLIKDYEDSNG